MDLTITNGWLALVAIGLLVIALSAIAAVVVMRGRFQARRNNEIDRAAEARFTDEGGARRSS